jgi:hypothetical protein
MPKVDCLFGLLVTVFHLLLDAWRLIRLAFNRAVLWPPRIFPSQRASSVSGAPRRPRAAAKLTLVMLSKLFPSATIFAPSPCRIFQLNQFQFDRFCIAARQVYPDTLFFRNFQEVRIFPLALFQTIPAEQFVFFPAPVHEDQSARTDPS